MVERLCRDRDKTPDRQRNAGGAAASADCPGFAAHGCGAPAFRQPQGNADPLDQANAVASQYSAGTALADAGSTLPWNCSSGAAATRNRADPANGFARLRSAPFWLRARSLGRPDARRASPLQHRPCPPRRYCVLDAAIACEKPGAARRRNGRQEQAGADTLQLHRGRSEVRLPSPGGESGLPLQQRDRGGPRSTQRSGKVAAKERVLTVCQSAISENVVPLFTKPVCSSRVKAAPCAPLLGNGGAVIW
jgi:hypothetical protein